MLDIPLPELQGLKTLKVAFHHATKDEVSASRTSPLIIYLFFQSSFFVDVQCIPGSFNAISKLQVVIHTIRLPKQSTVGDVINDLKSKVSPRNDPTAECV